MIDLVWDFFLWLSAGVARTLGRAEAEARENEAERRSWARIEARHPGRER